MLFSIQMETLAHTSPTPPVGRLLLMRSISFLFESKGHSKHKNTEPHRETGKPGGGGRAGTPTQCISNSQSEVFHPEEDPSYFQECHF